MTDAALKTQSQTDMLDPARAAALHATLDRPGKLPKAGDDLPPFWHHIYFWQAYPPAQLGPDGHPAVGQGLIPDFGLPHRMWAGGRLTFHKPLALGTPATKTSTQLKVARKEGRSGPLGFVTLSHQITQSGVTCLTEEQDLVYRGPLGTDRPAPPMARTDETACQSHSFTSTLLFRYSALTFNGHRIHYDLPHATGPEGYRGLVVHGPLLAQLLIHMAEATHGPLRQFSFRAVSPLMDFETAEFCMADRQMWVRGPAGQCCMTAEFEV